MPTVQSQMLKFVQRVDPRTKYGQIIRGADSGVAITSSTNASPIVVTASNHGFQTGDQVYIESHLVNTAVNNTQSQPNWFVSVLTANTFELYSDAALSIPSVGNGVGANTGSVTGALIGSVDGNLTRQKQLDIYNEARTVLAGYMVQRYSPDQAKKIMDGNVIANADLKFDSGSAPKPDGFIKELFLLSPDRKTTLSIIDPIDLPAVRNFNSSETPIVIRSGTTFDAVTAANVPDGMYHLYYFGVIDFTLTDVLGAEEVETFNLEWQPRVLMLAEAIASGQGRVDPNALAEKLFGGSK